MAVQTYQAIDRHETVDRAAIVAFYALLALVPFLGLVLAIALGTAGGIAAQLQAFSRQVMPEAADTIIQDQIHKIQTSPPVGVLSLSFAVLLWSSSSLFVAVMDATNAAYGVRDARPWWKRRLLAVLLALIESALLLGASVLFIAWPYLLGWFGLDRAAAAVATLIQWLVVVAALLASFALAYNFGPDVEQEWEWITPGATLGVLVLIAGTLGFRLYVQYGSSYSATYGTLAGVVVLLLWLDLVALALLVGAEINSIIEHAAPHGKSPGEDGADSPFSIADWRAVQQSPAPLVGAFVTFANAGERSCCGGPHPGYGREPRWRASSPLRGCRDRGDGPLGGGDGPPPRVPQPPCDDARWQDASFSLP